MIQIIIAIIVLILALAGGIFSIVKYKKTKEKKWLVIGLILTLVVIGALAYIFIGVPQTSIDYAPPEAFR
jgi:type IV secretory pathway TrbL component